MFKQSILIAGLLGVSFFSVAQSVKYKDLVFTDVTETKNLSYSPTDSSKNKKSHFFDLYQPTGDKSTGRPLIIWMHGGGFKFGTKEAKGIQLWSKTFAQRGYVCAALSYTLSKKFPIFNFDELKRSAYYAVLDAKQAVVYFKEHAKEYNIDPDKIILAGNSAGGMIALNAAYSSNAELAKLAGIADVNSDDKSVLKVAGIINLWGGIFKLSWLKNAKVPIVNIYGSRDSLVPPTHKDTSLYGGADIHAEATRLGIPTNVKVFEGYSHELMKHFNPVFSGNKETQERWLEAGQFTADFLYKTLYKK
ncbi:alpha/beta hydrolase [Mucilaginibacter sp. BJC16-A38]|uniref:alpha/beta hydrolase n=1 Tax=Mucilaginibacter phenanthrenivorans TaxID=1234842 RepID=UPI0021588435|nr:alpha/beta hydrolase [Mucilaginibacter phenanthrenivorans]MCR8561163.1 alpha/beta hydrolase [Mucilaginibacter phenanthrenivorans]